VLWAYNGGLIEDNYCISIVICFLNHQGRGGTLIDSSSVHINNLSSFNTFASSSSSKDITIIIIITSMSAVLYLLLGGFLVFLCMCGERGGRERRRKN
jgi:hypothetical protein